MTNGAKILLGVVGVGAIAIIIKNKKAIGSKPDLIFVKRLPFNYNSLTLPPFGVFVNVDQQANKNLLAHELVHWNQYQRMGLLGYYGQYFYEYVKDGYDHMPMEIEARANESDFCRINYTQCVRNGSAKTVSNPNFRD